MNKDILKKLLPYLVAILAFVAITMVYFSPLLEGKKLDQHDIKMFKGMSKEIVDFREQTGEEALWTNSMFGGMPAWQISVRYSGNLVRFFDDVFTLWLPYPASFVFLYFFGFFILMLVLRVNPWVSLGGAIAFAMSSYFFIILGAGHTSKAHAIGYMAPVLAGIILTYRGKYWQGALLTALALALEIKAGHLQITYYLLLIVLVYGIYELIGAFKHKQLPHFIKATGFLVVAALLAILTHSTNLWSTYEYGQDTMRGKPELTKNQTNKSSGLDRDYITHWSYGIGETWSLMIPNAKGGASAQIGDNRAIEKADRAYRNTISQQNAYWGDQPGTSGPVYVGVIVVFLFVLGMFVLNDKLKWVLFTVTVLSILLAWGKNFMPFTDFFIDYFPGYNKFRAVTMTLVIAELAIPVLAFLALNKIIQNPGLINKKVNIFNVIKVNAIYLSFGLTGGIILLFVIAPSAFFSFLSAGEQNYLRGLTNPSERNQVAEIFANIELVRMAIFRADALRSLLFVVLGAGLVFAFGLGKLNKVWLIAGISLLVLIDMFSVNKRYLDNDNFIRAKQYEVPFVASRANQDILKDTDPNFRVLDITQSTFNDASCSYFHKSIGGYHGAKLQRYQDLIDESINPEIMDLVDRLPGRNTQQQIDQILSEQQTLNMLNTKYIILRPDMVPLPNSSAFGNAWFVKSFKSVNNADEEIELVKTEDLKTTAIVDERFAKLLPTTSFGDDQYASINLTSYAPNHLMYQYKSASNQLAVFSEIYYDKGWNAYIDGEKVPYFRTNYVLRGMVLPEGEHEIEFKFEPKVWVIGEKVSFASSLLLILLVLGTLLFEGKKYILNK